MNTILQMAISTSFNSKVVVKYDGGGASVGFASNLTSTTLSLTWTPTILQLTEPSEVNGSSEVLEGLDNMGNPVSIWFPESQEKPAWFP